MEEADLKQSDSGRKRIRRRSHTRKAPLSSRFINTAEARREIVNALQLHRSSSSSASDSKTCTNSSNYPAINLSSFNHQNIKYYHHGLINSMPIPEPTWSTTPPSVSVQLSTPAIPAVHDQVLMDQFEWFDHNLSSSYSWWVGFLNSLDTKNSRVVSELMENSQVLGSRRCLDADQKSDYSDVDDHQTQSPFIDEWLIFPASEENEEQV